MGLIKAVFRFVLWFLLLSVQFFSHSPAASTMVLSKEGRWNTRAGTHGNEYRTLQTNIFKWTDWSNQQISYEICHHLPKKLYASLTLYKSLRKCYTFCSSFFGFLVLFGEFRVSLCLSVRISARSTVFVFFRLVFFFCSRLFFSRFRILFCCFSGNFMKLTDWK